MAAAIPNKYVENTGICNYIVLRLGAYEGRFQGQKKISQWLLKDLDQLMSVADLGH